MVGLRGDRRLQWLGPIAVTALVSIVANCGARTDLLANGTATDGGTVDAPSDASPWQDARLHCSSWRADHDPVQMSGPDGEMQLLDALPTSNGVLVGYSNILSPNEDPFWRVRRISWDGLELGISNETLPRNPTVGPWTAISIAQGFERAAAVAAEGQDMLFVPMDGDGAAAGAFRRTSGSAARELQATPNGYTFLETPYHGSGGPITLVTVDVEGTVIATRILVDSDELLYRTTRVVFDDGSFGLVWFGEGHAVYGQHFSEQGEPLAGRTTLHQYGPDDRVSYAVASSPSGLLAAWFVSSEGVRSLVVTPFDRDGVALGQSTRLADVADGHYNPVALSASGAEMIVAWTAPPSTSTSEATLIVQSLSDTGAPLGEPVELLEGIVAQNSGLDVVATDQRAIALYENRVIDGVQVFAIPLVCEVE